MIYKKWNEGSPEELALGVRVIQYVPCSYGAWHEPSTVIARIIPNFEGEEFGTVGYQTPHYILIWNILEGRESLKYLKSWPREARLEAGRFLRAVWKRLRQLKCERGFRW